MAETWEFTCFGECEPKNPKLRTPNLKSLNECFDERGLSHQAAVIVHLTRSLYYYLVRSDIYTPEGFTFIICGDLLSVTCDGHRFVMTVTPQTETWNPKPKTLNQSRPHRVALLGLVPPNNLQSLQTKIWNTTV